MSIKVMLVDDEAGIRLLLRKIIEKKTEFEVVCECDNFTEAVTMFTKKKPDVVFLDIEIVGASGLDFARIIADIEPKTKIIFATAHGEFMPQAFEVYAFDYLVKPFDMQRVHLTLERIHALQSGKVALEEKSIETVAISEKDFSRILIKGKESASFIDTEDIVLIQRENGNTVIYTEKDSFETSASIGDVEARLDPNVFMRSHKSYVINTKKIKRVEPYGRWTYVVFFEGTKKDALITSEKYEELKKKYD
ncbi:MAG: response regulator transcription factor [Lachnospiraceae bacterium]|nr:response regulator transcription factor [Lachnospiraceae bacterium]